MKNLFLLFVFALFGITAFSQSLKQTKKNNSKKDYPKSLANYTDFKNLVTEVESHREKRLIDLDTFLKMSQQKNTVILDTRSELRYKRKHLKGAIHLNFSDFTQENLSKLIPYPNTKILIYCNNNFKGDQIDFTSKVTKPVKKQKEDIKPITLALNIPTYINLFGYGYKNIYELDELVNINDSRITFEGTEAGK